MADQNWPNLAAMFYDQVDAYGDRPFLWAKREGTYKPLSWGDVAARVTPLARGLLQTGIKPGDRVVLVSENRPAWLIADIAIMAIGAITVPAYTTNTVADHLHVLKDSGCQGRYSVQSAPGPKPDPGRGTVRHHRIRCRPLPT